jgi:Tfp pilus assembly protein PilX
MKKKQKGFVLTLAILMLVVMSIMGITLVTLLSNDVRQNDSQDEY